jgi:hypothetical protein
MWASIIYNILVRICKTNDTYNGKTTTAAIQKKVNG